MVLLENDDLLPLEKGIKIHVEGMTDLSNLGGLPFELPSSWEAVEKQTEDLPFDWENPPYPFGQGISY